MIEKLTKDSENTLIALKNDLSKINTGRAQSDIFYLMKVNYYGTMTSLAHVSIISSLDHNRITIEPYEKDLIKPIEKVIRESKLNINPQIEGGVIRVCFPQLTLERRDEMIKLVKTYGEKAKISIRDHRRIAMKTTESSELSKNDASMFKTKIESIVLKNINCIDDIISNKTNSLNNI